MYCQQQYFGFYRCTRSCRSWTWQGRGRFQALGLFLKTPTRTGRRSATGSTTTTEVRRSPEIAISHVFDITGAYFYEVMSYWQKVDKPREINQADNGRRKEAVTGHQEGVCAKQIEGSQ